MSLPTVSQAQADLAAALAAAGIAEARLEAEMLLGEVTGRSREWLFLHPEELLTPEQAARLEALLSRRREREPLPYILGRIEWYGLTFRVTPAALIPRPETEILVEMAIARAREMGARTALDVGAGSGVIAVALAKHVPDLTVVAVDVSREALRLTRENARAHGVAERVSLVCCDLLSAIRGEFDCVLANLPYIPCDDFTGLQPEVRDFEPRVALDGGEDGIDLVRRLGSQLLAHLRTDGFAMLEVGLGQAAAAEKVLAGAGLVEVGVRRDYAGIERVVFGERKG